jgi:predicted AAA+ superfamily ATPase
MKELEQFLQRAEAVLARVEQLLPAPAAEIDWTASTAFRWRVPRDGRGYLQAVKHPASIRFDDLRNIGTQKEAIEQNTRQFIAGKPANNVLLTGARGTGKSSLIKACLAQFASQGLRLTCRSRKAKVATRR